MRAVAEDARTALRGLAATPWTSAVAGLVLALGIAAFAATLTAVRPVLWPPIGPRVVVIGPPGDHGSLLAVSQEDLDAWRGLRSLEAVEGFLPARFGVDVGESPRSIEGAILSPGFLRIAGLLPVLGSLPAGQSGDAVVVSSHRFWQRALGARPDVIGTRLHVDGVERTIVAVMEPRAELGSSLQELWVLDEALLRAASRGTHRLWAIGRLREGVSIEEAGLELAELEHGRTSGVQATLRSLVEHLVGPLRPGAIRSLLTAFLVLIVAFVNAANLLLARALTRESEWILRAGLGASPLRLARVVVFEGLWLGLGAAVLGVAGTRAVLQSWGLQMPAPEQWRAPFLQIDATIAAIALGAAVAAGGLGALLPACVVARHARGSLIACAEPRATASRRRRRRMVALGTLQMAFLISVAVSALYLGQRWWMLETTPPAMATEGVMAASVWRRASRGAGGDIEAFRDRLRRALEDQPGIEAAATSDSALALVTPRGSAPACAAHTARVRAISPGYLDLLRLPLRSGRSFRGPEDRVAAVAIVSRPLAETCWPPGALGQTIAIHGDPVGVREIVGVVDSAFPSGLTAGPAVEVYVPERDAAPAEVLVFATSRLSERSARDAIHAAVASVDPAQPVAWTTPLAQLVRDGFAPQRFAVANQGTFALLTILVVALGSLALAWAVARDARFEIATRLAIGAPPGAVTRAVGRGFATVIALGALAGVPAASWIPAFIDLVMPGPPVPRLPAFGAALAIAALAQGLPVWVQLRRAIAVQPLAVLQRR